jgi:hypothetical protein
MAYQGNKPLPTAQPGYTESPLAKNLRKSGDHGYLDTVIQKGVAAAKQEPIVAAPYPTTFGHHKPSNDGEVPE